MSTLKLKVLLIGPSKSGKSTLANFLADAGELPEEYRPTKGCRIMKFRPEGFTDVQLELWDVGGSREYESCWPAIAHGADGALVCVNGDEPDAIGGATDLDVWFRNIIRPAGLKSSCVNVVANHYSSGDGLGRPQVQIEGSLSKAKLVHMDINDEDEEARNVFSEFLQTVRETAVKRRDKQEMDIINS